MRNHRLYNKTNAKKITLFGSIGVNMGDELMNRVIVNKFESMGHNVKVAAMNPESYIARYGTGLHCFSSKKTALASWLPIIRGSDLIVIGGGTLVQNDIKRYVSGILIYAIAIKLISEVLGKKVIFLSLGINKLSGVNKILAKVFLRRIDGFVRDNKSIENLAYNRLLGNPAVMPDVGFYSKYYDHARVSKFSEGCEFAVISLAKESLNQDRLFEVLTVFINEAKAIGISKVIALCMDVRDGEEFEIYQNFIQKFNGDSSIIEIFKPLNATEAVDCIKNSKKILAIRLHAAIISVACGVTPFVISREDKQFFLKNIVGEENYSEISSSELIGKVHEYMRNPRNIVMPFAIENDINDVFSGIGKAYL